MGKEPPSYSCGVLGQVCKSKESVYTAADTQCHPKADDKGHFAEKILAFAKEKNLAVQEMRRITDELVEEFEEELRCKSPGRFQAAEKWFEEELEQGVSFDKKILSELSERLFVLRTMIPEHGRIAYGLYRRRAGKRRTNWYNSCFWRYRRSGSALNGM